MRNPVVLITGANGELGNELIHRLAEKPNIDIVALDLRPLDEHLVKRCRAAIVGDILDQALLERLVSEFEIHAIYHLAALLSTRAEYTPAAAHNVNVNGTLNLLQLANEQARWHGNTVRFIFPSSIAVYGLPPGMKPGSRLQEHQYTQPTTMYGCNKLYCEQLGRYYSLHYQQLAHEQTTSGVDFRALRFPGLISAFTLPSGGTTDYAPEMMHAAAKGDPYHCFVPPEERLPFMVMADAIRAILALGDADHEKLSQRSYNVTSFTLSANEVRQLVLEHFPTAEIGFHVDPARTGIVATWPEEVDDSAARRDWGWAPEFGAESAFRDYLVPNIRKYYGG
ncbi:MAG: NAD-dependent epimerase/dehydratase family protein [Planctomycetota bacterium]